MSKVGTHIPIPKKTKNIPERKQNSLKEVQTPIPQYSMDDRFDSEYFDPDIIIRPTTKYIYEESVYKPYFE